MLSIGNTLAILNTMTTAITLTETQQPEMIDTMSDTPLGLTEIGDLLGVSRQRAFTLSKRADFPAPTANLKAGRIWDKAAVEAWAKTWDRSNQGGRPKRKPVENAPPPAAEPEPEIAATPVPNERPSPPEPAPRDVPWPPPLPDRSERAKAQMGIAEWIQELDDDTTLRLLERARQEPTYDDVWRMWAEASNPRWAGLMVLHANYGAAKRWLDEDRAAAE